MSGFENVITVNNPAHTVAKLTYGRGLRVNNI